ncbi:MAG: GNAT family N-acetyltransferase [Corynebacterium glutamicum]|nr:GNAT family N-acetyltransferase [Corynebacterium glutamicum]
MKNKKETVIASRPIFIFSKRIIDSALIVISVPITLPIATITAIGIKLSMGSPIIFKQTRIGLNEQAFTLLKFRSMLPETDVNGNKRTPSERITKFGKFIRKTSLDEIPQLLNVLKGDMALVGPRPLLVEYLPYYKDSERARHSVRPGITGRAQISGRNHLGWDSRLSIDSSYAVHASLFDDFKIIFSTIIGAFKGSDVATPGDGADFLSEHRSFPIEDGFGLRRFERRDIPARVRWFNDPATLKYMSFGSQITLESTEKWLLGIRNDPSRGDYVLYEIESDRPLAVVGYRHYDGDDLPAVYIAVDPDEHGRGIGSRSVNLLLQHMRETLRLKGAYADLYRENVASKKLWEKASMVEIESGLPEGRIRMAVYWDGS